MSAFALLVWIILLKKRMLWQVFATLEDLPMEVTAAELVSPTLIIIGRVVALSYLWTQKLSAGESEDQNAQKQPTASSFNSEITAAKREPRARSLRGSDPSLPSQN